MAYSCHEGHRYHAFKKFLMMTGTRSAMSLVLCTTLLLQGLASVAGFSSTQYHQRSFIPSPMSTYSRSSRLHMIPSSSSSSSPMMQRRQQQKKPFFVSPDQLKQLQQSADIVSLVESYQLDGFQRRNNDKAIAICPFHNDNNPSMSIDGERGIYKCFSCGAGGNAFHFVREYSKLHQHEEVNFLDAVQLVNDEFNNGPRIQMETRGSGGGKSKEEQEIIFAHRERLMLANTAAAVFYSNNLATVLSAGGARYHLRSRGITADTAKEFSIGFAQDTYKRTTIIPTTTATTATDTSSKRAVGNNNSNNNNNKPSPRFKWGKDSLVHYLRDLDFTPQEILDAGLAIRLQKKKKKKPPAPNSQQQGVQNINQRFANRPNPMATASSNANNTSVANTSAPIRPTNTETVKEDVVMYTDLMDRFRGRLMVPIFDRTGNNVLGFGGRILGETPKNAILENKYPQPKYLNSPQTKIFLKKEILFGHSIAHEVISKKSTDQLPLVIVEGYMDAISLWQAGIKNVVASMGAALTIEQLSAAATLSGSRGGTVILCLDNDDAGLGAVERICNSGMMATVAESFPLVRFTVASLPDGIKDPAEFLESDDGSFVQDVLDPSVAWMDWYLNRILATYDSDAAPDTPGSFGDVFEKVAQFLSNIKNAGERTKRACNSANTLATLIAQDVGSSTVSTTVRVQLESDLVDRASRLVSVKNSVSKRLEMVEGGSETDVQIKLSNLARGDGASGEDDTTRLSSKSLKKIAPPSPPKVQTRRQLPPKPTKPVSKKMRRSYKAKQEAPPLTPHFSGFQVENDNDRAWLGFPDKKWGSKNKKQSNFRNSLGQKAEPVYFNSNEFHGMEMLSSKAKQAGYVLDGTISVDRAKIADKGLGTLIETYKDSAASSVEDSLFHILVKYRSTRLALKKTLQMNRASSQTATIRWSSPDRAWLFQCLVEEAQDVSNKVPDDDDRQLLRSYLSSKDDCPSGAFGANDYLDIDADVKSEASFAFENEDPSSASSNLKSDDGVRAGAPSRNANSAVDVDFEVVVKPSAVSLDAKKIKSDTIEDTPKLADQQAVLNGLQDTLNGQSSKVETLNSPTVSRLPIAKAGERVVPSVLGGSEYEEDIESWASSFIPSAPDELADEAIKSHTKGNSRNMTAESKQGEATTATMPPINGSSRGATTSPNSMGASYVDSSAEATKTRKLVEDTEAPKIQNAATVVSPEESSTELIADTITTPKMKLATEHPSGTLDVFFVDDADDAGGINSMISSSKPMVELAIQELYSNLLLHSAKQEISQVKDALALKADELQRRATLALTGDQNKTVENATELTQESMDLVGKIRDLAPTIHKLQTSTKSISKELMSHKVSYGNNRARISRAQVNELSAKLDAHMLELDQWTVGESDGGEAYEDYLERMAHEWGDFYEDDKVWSPDDIVIPPPIVLNKETSHLDANFDYLFDDEEEEDNGESMEEFDARIARDWGDLAEGL